MGAAALSGYVEMVEVKRIRPSKYQLRSDAGPLEELMASVVEKGLLEPIVVRPVGDAYEVVAGNRRLEVCRRLKFRSTACHVVELDDKEAYEVALTENIQRRTLNPVEEGQAFKRYVDDFGYGGISELARRIGKSQSYVSRRLSLLSLPGDLRERVMRGRITPSAAAELVPLDDESRAELAEFITETTNMNREEIRKLARYMARKRRRRNEGGRQSASYYDQIRVKDHMVDRTLAKCVASLKENMTRFEDAIGSLDDEYEDAWVVREALTWHRQFMSNEVDNLLRLRKRFKH